jgi:hypothetical protein
MQRKLAILVPLALALAPFDAKGGGCDLHQLRGTYAVSCQGFLGPPLSPASVPVSVVGLQSADGAGGFTGTFWVSVGGQQLKESQKSVNIAFNPDCISGTITFDVTYDPPIFPNGSQIFAFVVLDHGDRIRSIEIDEGTTSSCLLERISNAPSM